MRKRIYPKQSEVLLTQESDDFDMAPYKNCLTKYKESLVQQKHLRSLKLEHLSPKTKLKDRSSSAVSLHNKASIQNIFPLASLVKLESALYNGTLDKANKEYCGRLKSIAGLIMEKINN